MSARPRTLAESVAACRKIQGASQIPIGCSFSYADDAPSLMMTFRDMREANIYLSPMADHVAGPFCSAANSANRRGKVTMVVSERWARKFECEEGRWSEWFDLADRSSAQAQSGAQGGGEDTDAAAGLVNDDTLGNVTRGCNAIHQSTRIPVDCRIREISGVPSVLLGFRNQQEAEAYIGPTAKYVAVPFCDAANKAGAKASVFVMVGETNARQYRCDLGTWGDWFNLSPSSRPPARRERPPANVVRF